MAGKGVGSEQKAPLVQEGRDWLSTHAAFAAALAGLDRLAVLADAATGSPAQLTARLEEIFVRLPATERAIAAATGTDPAGLPAPASIAGALDSILAATQPTALTADATELAVRLAEVARHVSNIQTDLSALEGAWHRQTGQME